VLKIKTLRRREKWNQCLRPTRHSRYQKYQLTLSTAEAGRFLHTVPSTLWSTCVSAFTPSPLRTCLQLVCHHPVIPIL
jgi:hypothetical protein